MDFNCFDSQLNRLETLPDWPQQRSFLYGDGHFTTIKVVKAQPAFLDAHLERLQQANARLLIADVDWPALSAQVKQTAKIENSGYIRVHISRGQGGRGYGGIASFRPFIFISNGPFEEALVPQEFVLGIADTRLGQNKQLAGLKHNNRLEQVLIAAELEQKSMADALVMDVSDNLIETNKANVFWSDGTDWYTPSLELSGVAGVMRAKILQMNPTVKIVSMTLQKVMDRCQSMLVCNSLIQVRPVSKIADLPLDVKPTKKLDLTFL